VETWGEASFIIATGARNPWKWLADFASILIIIFVVDASSGLWRLGKRQRALLIGGSITFFILAAGIHSPLVDAGLVKTPYMISFAFLAIVAAMNYELGSDVVRASVLSRKVARSERRWRSLLENVELVVVGIDPDGHVNYLNPFYQRLTGFDADQILGRPIQDLLVASERQAMTERLKVAGLEGPRPQSQWTLRCASGEERRVVWSSVKLLDLDGKFAGILSVGADVTDRVRAQRELQQTQRNLDRLSRANLLGELVTALAHELNQPLTAILSNAQAGRRIMSSSTPDLDEIRAILDDIVRDDKRAGEVIHSLRGMLQGQPGPREIVDLNELTRGVIDLVQRELDSRQVAVRLKTAGGPLKVHAATAELQQVVMNLLMNAAQAMRDTPSSERSVELETSLQGDSAVLTVRDHGCGVSDENLPGIFEPFTTTKSTGFGMGLAICRRLVEKHGGQISARNNPEGGGSTFEFTLPVHKPKA
jgi:PAS domain S-box-containing protein